MEFSNTVKWLPKFLSAVIPFVVGIITMGADAELAGTLLLSLASIIISLSLFVWIFKKFHWQFPISLQSKERYLYLTAFGVISIIGFIEVLEAEIKTLELAFIFVILLAAIVSYSYYKFSGKKFRWQSIIFGIILGIGLLFLNDEYAESETYIITLIIYFSAIVLLLLNWIFLQIKSIIKLKSEQKTTEIMRLQSQVNPHFFFNMLNNLYGLIEVDSKKAQALILKLSDLMRYSIYDGQKNMVSLEEEITYITNFLELHKMRYHKEIEIKFVKEITNSSIQVMPLMFINLIENAFKHGVEHLRKDAFVHIKLNATQKEVSFEIMNNFDQEEVPKIKGIGLDNLKRRLQLVYPDKHEFEIKKNANIYSVKMRVTI